MPVGATQLFRPCSLLLFVADFAVVDFAVAGFAVVADWWALTAAAARVRERPSSLSLRKDGGAINCWGAVSLLSRRESTDQRPKSMRASTIGHYNLAVGHGAITAWRRGSAVGILEWDIAMHDAIVRAAQSNDHHRRVHGVVAVIELADEACDRSHTALEPDSGTRALLPVCRPENDTLKS
jgi:hypothetical protein